MLYHGHALQLRPNTEYGSIACYVDLKIRKHDTAVVATPDGTIYFVEINSGTILWSFASGSSIYAYHQALPHHEGEMHNASTDDDNFYLDIGEDWELYVHGNGFKKVVC
jgi:outer membrane protein assembly factor BamB